MSPLEVHRIVASQSTIVTRRFTWIPWTTSWVSQLQLTEWRLHCTVAGDRAKISFDPLRGYQCSHRELATAFQIADLNADRQPLQAPHP